MINAQRLGENVIREAKQKAAEIIRSANMKADVREQRARDDQCAVDKSSGNRHGRFFFPYITDEGIIT